MNKSPLVSVIMASYNSEKYIPDAIESILSQTMKDFELIIYDDSSTDKTFQIAQEYAKGDSRIVVCRNEKNLGVSETSNKAISISKGKYICKMDSDDVSYPYRLEVQSSFLENNPDVVMVGGNVLMVNEDLTPIQEKKFPKKHEEIIDASFLLVTVQQGASMINRSKLPSNFPWYDPEIRTGEDWDLFYKLAPYGKFANIDKIMIKYRRYKGQSKSLSSYNPKEVFYTIEKVRDRAIKKYGLKVSYKRRIQRLIQRAIIKILPNHLVIRVFYILRKFVLK